MNSDATKLVADQLRDIRMLIADAQRQEGDHFRETIGRILTDVVNVLEAIATSGGDKPFPSTGREHDKSPPDPKGGAF